MVNHSIMVGNAYTLHTSDGHKMLDAEVTAGTKTGLFRFARTSNPLAYLRIHQNGLVDVNGGGGGFCNFSVEVDESGFLSLIRGPFRLAYREGDKSFTSVSKDSPTSTVTLWAVEAKGAIEATAEVSSPMVQLRHGSLHFGPFLRKDLENGHVLFQGLDGGYLRMLPGTVDAKGGGGQPCQFIVDTTEDCSVFLRSTVEPRRYLGVSSWGALAGREVENSRQSFHLEAACTENLTRSPNLTGHADFDECIDLTPEERMTFIEDGFLIIRNVIPASLLDAALAHINAVLLTPGSVTKDDDGKLQVCAAAKGSDEIKALLYGTPLWTLLQRLLGRGRAAPCNASQMALRAPNLNQAPLDDDSITSKQWHIDGMGEGKHSPFSILLGIALSEQTKPNCGNLVAYRGSHHVLQPLLRSEVESASSLFSDEKGQANNKPSLSGGQQILLRPGDAVLLHQKVAHRVGVNNSPDIRYQTYFRVSHVDHAQKVEDGSLLNSLWDEFEGLKDDIAQHQLSQAIP